MALIESMYWRYATKKFDRTKKVSDKDIETIIEAARMAPSSSGLQPFELILITNKELKEKLVPIAMGQQQIADASHLLIFAAWENYTEERIDKVYEQIEQERGLPKGRFKEYTDRLKGLYLKRPASANFEHAARQAYIAFGFALAMAAELKVDSTPIEGFNNDLLDQELELSHKGLKSVTMMPLGYRDEANDWLVKMKKVRKPLTSFLTEIK